MGGGGMGGGGMGGGGMGGGGMSCGIGAAGPPACRNIGLLSTLIRVILLSAEKTLSARGGTKSGYPKSCNLLEG
jgi:hypothetical protein